MRLTGFLAVLGVPLLGHPCQAADAAPFRAPADAASFRAPADAVAYGAPAGAVTYGAPADAGASGSPPAAQGGHGRVWSPVPIGRFGDWQAATHQENGQTVCYALSYATSSQPLFQGRGHVVLTVAMRPHNRDAVAILLGYSVLPHAGASVQAGGKRLHLYLEGRSAFAPHGHEAVEAFEAGKQAVGSFPGPRGLTLTDVFSLNGFAAAYAAIVKACPA